MTASIEKTDAGILISGRPAVEVFRARTIASALRLYAKTGMKVSRTYSPTNMLAAATQITCNKYKRGQYEQAAQDLIDWADVQVLPPVTC